MRTKETCWILFVLTLLSIRGNGQNLVPNPSFESNSACPTGANWSVLNWRRLLNHSGTADYMHTCSTNATLVIPGPIATQLPLDGNAYMAIFAYSETSGNEVREYIQVQLNSPLVANQYYHVSYFVSMADFSYAGVNFLGALFTNTAVTGNNTIQHLQLTPQIITNNVITDKVNWVEISGDFQAVGGEKYLTIGNFASDQELTIINLDPTQPQWAYYFIDTVSVEATNLGVGEHPASKNIAFPNPFNNRINFQLSNEEEIEKIQIFSTMQLIREFENPHSYLELGDLPKGVYIAIVSVKNNQKKYIQKIIKN